MVNCAIKTLKMKKLFFVALLGLLFCNVAVAQDRSTDTIITEAPNKMAQDASNPQYPGGWEAFYKYLYSRLSPPALPTKKHGKLIVSFVIGTDGSVQDVKIIKGLKKDIDLAVVKAFEESIKWKPGTTDGKPVSTPYTMPLTFNN